MARGRFLNKTVATDDKVAELMRIGGPVACLFHHRIIAFLDMNGNVRADQYWLKANLFPRDAGITPEDCLRISRELAAVSLADLYTDSGMDFLHFPGFGKNQPNLRADREKPECPEYNINKKQDVGKPQEVSQPIAREMSAISISVSESVRLSESVLGTTYPPDLPEPKSADATWMSDIVTQWNQMATELGYPKVSRLTPERKKHLATRNKEPAFDFPAIVAAFKQFKPLILSGRNGSEWKPDFDYVIRSQSCYVKILEGKFASNGDANGHVKGYQAGNLRKERKFEF